MRRTITTLLLAATVPAVQLSAHPGHDHSDLSTVVSQPFVDLSHVVTTLAVIALLVCAVVPVLRARRRTRDSRRSH
ncbi:MAG: hypothetical protein D6781_07925 [Verrucomicrobia bacterium]|nr:MAG: hypothetical protein D6781_07925 [Verrucomicrobiota bacterium]